MEAMVVKRKRFFSYLKKIHQDGGFWLNCVQLKRQVREGDVGDHTCCPARGAPGRHVMVSGRRPASQQT